jgi:CRISPR type III-A-associated protein Csm2
MTTMKELIEKEIPESTVKEAKALATILKQIARDDQSESKEASKTQIRKLFATMRQIQMTWRQNPEAGYHELVLFGPRLLYQSAKHPSLKPLAEHIQEGIEAVGKDDKKLQRLVDFFEATVAYFVAN